MICSPFLCRLLPLQFMLLLKPIHLYCQLLPHSIKLLLMTPFLFWAFLALENGASAHLFPLSHQDFLLPLIIIPLPLDLLLELSEVILFLNDQFLSDEQSFLLAENPLLLEHRTGLLLLCFQIVALIFIS